MHTYLLNPNKVKILNTCIDNISSEILLDNLKQGGIVFTPNVDHLVKLQKDFDFYQAYQKANYVVCDSQIVYWTSRLLGEKINEKISGSDFFPKFYRYYQKNENIKIFLLGGIGEVAEQAKVRINEKVGRSIVVGAYSPSIGFEKNEQECKKIINLINNSSATVLAVGVGAPKQEKWIVKYKSKLNKIKIFLAIGASLEFEAETVKRAPKWISNTGLEWLHRLIHSPRRLWKRYFLESWPFFWLILLQKLNLYQFQSPNQSFAQKSKSTKSIDKAKDSEKITDVLMFGPCLLEQGGMGAVQKHIVDRASKELNIRHITIWNGKNSTVTLFLKAFVSFLTQLFKNKVDIVHLHVSERGSVLRNSILAILAFAFSKPVIMHTHGCEFHIFYDNLPSIAQQLINKIWKNCSCVVVLSKSWKNIYVKKCGLNPDRVLVKYNPVAVPNDITNSKKTDKTTFVFLGKIAQRKGVFDLLKAFAKLPSALRDKTELIVAGSGEIGKASALAKELEIDSLVSFPGWINPEQRDRLLQRADVFVLPSYNEGLPMALLEAMSWRLPVITTPVGGIPEIIVDNETGLLVEPGNIQRLTRSIQTLVDNESLRSNLGEAAYEKALYLDVENYIRDFLDVYRSVLLENV